MGRLFQLPDEILLSSILAKFPCRETQVRSLATLLHSSAAPCNNIILHGTEATGKTAITTTLLESLSTEPSSIAATAEAPPPAQASAALRYAIISSSQCITARHLYETIVAVVADALGWDRQSRRCETLAQLVAELQKLVETPHPTRQQDWNGNGQEDQEEKEEDRFVLVLDGIDRQREAPATLLPGLARIPEIIPSVTCVFIVTSPQPSLLRTAAALHIHFPAYTKQEFVQIMTTTASPPSEPTVPGASATDIADLWQRFCAAVHDSLARPAARTLPALRTGCRALWPRFTAPIRAGNIGPREFSKLLIAARVHFQDESLLCPSIVAVRPGGDGSTLGSGAGATPTSTTPAGVVSTTTTTPDLSALLPRTARLILLAAYLASHNASKHDLTLFSTYHHGKRRRRGGGFAGTPGRSRAGAKHRKIARRLLGAHVFVLERMMAIFAAVRSEWVGNEGRGGPMVMSGLDGDVAMAVSTLASLRLLIRVGTSGDLMDRGGKWRINVGWDMIRALGRSMSVELEDWLIE